MGNVTKKEIVERVAEKTGLSQIDTKLVVETFFDAVAETLQGGKNIEIRGFGRFKVREQATHIARNPRTNESVKVEKRFKASFEASNKLRDFVNSSIMKD